MKQTRIPVPLRWLLLLLPLVAMSCDDKLADYYKEPDWLKGSIYEVLQDRGDYTIFLKGIDLAGFKPMVNGKSILTVMAPNDEAFTTYLEATYGTGATIEALTQPELKKLIGFHLLYYAFDREKLINFRPNEGDAATDEERDINAGLFYKHRTKSQDGITLELDTAGNWVNVYHLERFLPVFSYRMFQTKQIAADYNYEYFYPGTPWDGEAGFNVSNAKVDEYSVLSDNGYVYLIDKVLKPLETIYKELASNPDYSDFLALYDKYDYYTIDQNLTLDYGNGTDLYQHYHTSPMANIASEWPVTDYKKVSDLAFTSYSVFAPSNEAFTRFFDDYWKVGGYDSLYEVSPQSIEYLLYNCVYPSSLVFPEEIKKGLIKNSYGTVIKFDVDAVKPQNRMMCVNGTLYGCDELTPPAMFGSVTGPAFQYKKFSYFLKMMTTAELVMTLCSDATSYFMLYPSDAVMNASGITLTDNVLYRGTNKVGSGSQQNYVYSHVVSRDGITGSYDALPLGSGSGDHVFRTLTPGSVLYWYMSNGRLTNSVKFNELLYVSGTTEDDVFCELEELNFREGWTNGKTYAYTNSKKPFLLEGSQENAIYPKFVPMMLNNRNDASKPYYGFIQLLDLADMYDTETQSINAMVESCLLFLPTTNAIKQAILDGKVPGLLTTNTTINDSDFFVNCTITDQSAMQYYLLKYFIPFSSAVISNYPYVGWEEDTSKGGLPTLQTYDVVDTDGKATTITTRMHVTDTGGKLKVQEMDNNGVLQGQAVEVVGEYHYFPFIFDDACVHFIKEVL